MNNPPFKRCTKCGTEYPATLEFFDQNKDGQFGLHSCCKQCRSEKARKWREQNSERCASNDRRWAENNRERVAEKTRRYRERHPEQIAEYVQYVKASHPRRHADAQQRYRHAYPDKKYVRTPEQSRVANQRRRARQLHSDGRFSVADIQHKYEMQKGLCAYCDCALNGIYHIDHVVPISRGGSNSIENIVLSCPQCNLSKGAKTLSEWERYRAMK
jgi:5-methylcytosine-specific restriction endonuclease McrA